MSCNFQQVFITSYTKNLAFDQVHPTDGVKNNQGTSVIHSSATMGQSEYAKITYYEYMGFGAISNTPSIMNLRLRCQPQISRDGVYVVSKFQGNFISHKNCDMNFFDALNEVQVDTTSGECDKLDVIQIRDIKFKFCPHYYYEQIIPKRIQNGAIYIDVIEYEIEGYARTNVLSLEVKEQNGLVNGQLIAFEVDNNNT